MSFTNLNEGQQLAFHKVLSGKNIYLYGSAGSGKSFLISRIVSHYKATGLKIGITATTGISAIQIKGRTIHGYLGIGLATKSASDLYFRNRRKFPMLIKKLRELNCLIVDEASMLSAELLDKVSDYLVLVRGVKLAFGGIQVIICGDFCQLPPVSGDYCFKSKAWESANLETMILVESMRQAGDIKFRDMLEELRWGKCDTETLAILRSLKNTEFSEGIEPTVLYSKNVDVDKVNIDMLSKLVDSGHETKTYKIQYSDNELAKAWAESLRIDAEIMLCVGAQIMITVNLNVDGGVVNGSRGIITELLENMVRVRLVNGSIEDIIYYKLDDEMDESLWFSYIPLKLAYAISIHKSQSLTLDAVVMDLGLSIFCNGQAYTALSRARDLKSVRVLAISSKSFKVSPDVLKFYGKSEIAEL
jgi:ATP-dependent DNA helicase PIF1